MTSIPEPAPSTNINLEQFRGCSGCKTGRIPALDPRKTCQSCREKRRAHSQRYHQRKREERKLQLVEQSSSKVEKEERFETAEGEVNKRLKTSHVTSENVGAGKKLVNVYGNEYQTAGDMYHTLTVSSKSKRYLFDGHFSIVANPETGNKTRVKLVAKDLRSIANIPFESRSISISSEQDEYQATFSCLCYTLFRSHYRPDPDVIASDPPGCNGRIIVTSQDDKSHPLIPGQKITVRVQH